MLYPQALFFLKRYKFASITALATTLTALLWVTIIDHSGPWTSITDKHVLEKINPIFDQEQMQKFTLSNGVQLLLMHDPTLKNSGAAISVQAGSWDDPEGMNGMAHFCEHALFLGSKHYPKVDDYSRFITSHNGLKNAYTSPDRTVYMMTSSHGGFIEALDRLCDQIAFPLFKEEAIESEKQAIQEELDQKKNQDGYLNYLLQCWMSDPTHDAHKFHIGNQTTLKNIGKKEVSDWWKKHYRAPNIRVVIYSPLSPKKIKKTISNRLITLNPEARQVPLRGPWWDQQAKSKRLIFASSENAYKISLSWPIAQMNTPFYSPKQDWIGRALIHNNDGGLFHILHKLDWVHDIQVHPIIVGNGALFTIYFDLTKKGYENREHIIYRTYELMHDLAEIEKLPDHIYKERKRTRELSYKFGERSHLLPTLMHAAAALIDENLSTYPDQSILPHKKTVDRTYLQVKHMLNQPLLEIDTVPQDYLDEHNISLDMTHPNLNSFKFSSLTPFIKESDMSIKRHARMQLFPRPNPLIPQDDPPTKKPLVFNREENVKLTNVLKKSDLTVYMSEDNYFGGTKSQYRFKIYTPLTQTTLYNRVLLDIWCECLQVQHKTFFNNAALSGYEISISPGYNSLECHIGGWTSGIESVVNHLLHRIGQNYSPANHFNFLKERLKHVYEQKLSYSPYLLAQENIWVKLLDRYYHTKDKLDALSQIQKEDFIQFSSSIMRSNHLDILALTPLSSQQINHQSQAWKNILPTSVMDRPKKLTFSMPPLSKNISIHQKSALSGNALCYLIDHGSMNNNALMMAIQVLSNDLSPKYFQSLRSEKQLGYIVSYRVLNRFGRVFSLFTIQSAHHDNEQLIAETKEFIFKYIKNIDNISKHEFDQIKSSIMTTLLSPPDNTNAYINELNEIVYDCYNDKGKRQCLIQALRKLTYNNWKAIIGQAFDTKNRFSVTSTISSQQNSGD